MTLCKFEHDGEVAWYSGDLPMARLEDSTQHEGEYILFFTAPPGCDMTTNIRVTKEPTYSTESEHVWHIDIAGDIVTILPSIHYIGHFHSPNPVQFRLSSTPLPQSVDRETITAPRIEQEHTPVQRH